MTNDNTNSIQPRGDVSPSLDPGTLLPHAPVLDVENTRGRLVLDSARSALTSLHRELSLINDARKAAFAERNPNDIAKLHKAMHGNGKTPFPDSAVNDGAAGNVIPLPPAKAREFNAAAEIAFKRAATNVDRQMKVLRETRETISDLVRTAITDPHAGLPASIATQAETRAHFKAMDPAKRTALLMDRVEKGDIATAHAILNAAPFLSGMDDKAHAEFRARVEHKFAPQARAQLDATDAVLGKVMTASEIFVSSYAKARVPEPVPAESAALAALRKGEA